MTNLSYWVTNNTPHNINDQLLNLLLFYLSCYILSFLIFLLIPTIFTMQMGFLMQQSFKGCV